ncbi:MAG: type VI secretion system ATPase TssH [Planctomycetes bacterium]|nr:type VI secretion system ATPase TssH [Planctomycetota bacterium]
MASVDLKELVGKLGDTPRRGLEGAAGLCLSRTNYNVEIEHWLLKLLEATDTDVAAILRHFGVDSSRLTADLTRSIDRLKTGNARPPALSQNLVDLTKAAWLYASIDFESSTVRSGHLIYALVVDDSSARNASVDSDEFQKISPESLRSDFFDITSKSIEAGEQAEAVSSAATPSGAPRPMGSTKTPSLDQYTIDLTELARRGDIDPVLGRDSEIRQMIDILTRRRQNNPILTGEAGVGKTAVAEGFALRIAGGDVPDSLKNVALRTLDLGLLQAGAGVKGEFENRLKGVIKEVKSSPTPIILFIDEAHTLVGAGGQAGQGDAANLLKPALARGELRTVAATTWAEYKKYFEKDAALARRFQVVKVEEPEESAAVEMVRGLAATLEGHHGVRILDAAIVDAVALSSRYITGRQLPDKAISLLDTSCARVGLSQTTTPPAIEDCQRRIEQLGVAIDILSREAVVGADHTEKIDQLQTDKSESETELEQLQARRVQESELVANINQLTARLKADHQPDGSEGASDDAVPASDDADKAEPTTEEGPSATEPLTEPLTETTSQPLTPEQSEEMRGQVETASAELAALQGDEPLVHVCVDSSAVAATVAAWTGIPVGRMMSDEIENILKLKERMEKSIVGQSHALDLIGKSIRTSRANLTDPCLPVGVFLLVGPSGVGKTETAITLANLIYGGEQNMTVINMSEFKEEHKVSLLMGAPPGYIGYGEGGVMTEAVRRKPHSVLLLDEMEKAHPGVQDIFYQVFDKGTMKDGEGRDIDFKNTVIIMTSNAASEAIVNLCADPETAPEPEELAKAIFPELLKTFKPAFLGRLVVIPYYPLNDQVMTQITELKLGKIGRRIKEHYKAEFSYAPELVASIVNRCTEVDTGARNIDEILTRTLLPDMSAEILSRMGRNESIQAVRISLDDNERIVYDFD